MVIGQEKMAGRSGGQAGGFTLLELVVVVSIIAVLSMISIPLIARAMDQYRSRGAAEAIVGAVREAKARAVASGWQYRVIGYTGAGAVQNAFRIEGMDPSGGGVWPAQVSATGTTFGSNQYAGRWTSLQREFGGSEIAVSGGGGRFVMTFDGRGILPATGCVPITACLDGFPITVIAPSRTPRNIQVTAAGGARIY